MGFIHFYTTSPSQKKFTEKIHTKWVSLISVFALRFNLFYSFFPVFVCLDTTFYCSEYLDAMGERKEPNKLGEREGRGVKDFPTEKKTKALSFEHELFFYMYLGGIEMILLPTDTVLVQHKYTKSKS